jgi:hypothetical protein
MSAIDGITQAYHGKYDLTRDRSAFFREELSLSIGELMSGRRPKLARASGREASC